MYATEEDAFQRLLEGAVAINGEGAVTEEAARIIKERGIRRYKWGKKVSTSITAREPLLWVRTASLWNRESAGTRFGKGEGKYNGDSAVTEKAARIIKKRGIRRYMFWEGGEGKITAKELL